METTEEIKENIIRDALEENVHAFYTELPYNDFDTIELASATLEAYRELVKNYNFEDRELLDPACLVLNEEGGYYNLFLKDDWDNMDKDEKEGLTFISTL